MKKSLILPICLLTCLTAKAQAPDWQHLDLERDGIFGISTDKAYTELLKGKKSKPVVVAILDSGTDTSHVDLAPVIWNNPKEKSKNGKDYDHNGFVNDTHGWDFIGGNSGNVQYDNLELTRLVRRFNEKDTLSLPTGDLTAFNGEKAELEKKKRDADNNLKYYTNYLNALNFLIKQTGKTNPTTDDLKALLPKAGKNEDLVKYVIAELSRKNDFTAYKKDIQDAADYFKVQTEYQLNTGFDPRPIVGDHYNDAGEHRYGNRDVFGPSALHGTHVAGIVGAVRGDTAKVRGIADQVRLMIVRAVPDGDERDKDIANGIRYAADNGAKVINMSFGKPYSWNKAIVDSAMQYALAKDVLLVQAAGNSAEDIDSAANFPNRRFLNGQTAGAWIVVGASGWKNDTTLAASFSNYGKTAVDVFAPGVQILSTIPGGKYAREDGTSMASPVVAGLAALIREYYPKLTAMEVKDIILRSVVKVGHPVKVRKNGHDVLVPFTDLCVTGGIVNAYQALKLAAHFKM